MTGSRMYNNGVTGLTIFASKCVAINCVIEYNFGGICIVNSKDIELIRNSVFGNHGMGIVVFGSEVNISENSVFDNGLWGISFLRNTRSHVSLSRIFRNNAGGVCVGYQTKEFRSVIEMNKIYDNDGPAFVQNVHGTRYIKMMIMSLRVKEDLSTWIVESTSTSPTFPSKFCDNEEYNNKESEKLNLCVPYCSNCRKDCKPKMCKKCFTAGYCGVACRDEHLPKHETICEVLRGKSSYLVSLMKEPKPNEPIEEPIERLPKKSKNRHAPRKRFIVKVRSATTLDNGHRLMLYDEKRRLHKTFDSKFIKELVKEFGVLCELRQYAEKKLYFYCVSESNGRVRLFTNEFPGFQSW